LEGEKGRTEAWKGGRQQVAEKNQKEDEGGVK
jgi:hypothetical protein